MKLTRLLLPAVVCAVWLGAMHEARATIVERVVAVIGERPVLWTELLHRAAASRVQIRLQTHDLNVVSVQEQEMYRELLERMIDDRLEEQQADRAHIAVSPEEIDRGIANIAAQAQAQQGRPVTAQDVFAEVHRRGLTEQDFREEIRRQILEGKLIELRVRPRVRVTDQDARSAYQHWTSDLKDQQPVDVRILALRIMPQSGPEQIQARMTFAQSLAQQAQANPALFCGLVAQYSDDVATRGSCGSRGAQPFASLLPPIQNAIKTMPAGTVSDPIPVQIGADQVLVVLMPLGQSRVPPYEQVKNDMMQKAMIEGLERARKQWLDELRHSVYIDVRL